MRYNQQAFTAAVGDYRKLFGDLHTKSVFVMFHIENTGAFYSLAPLSRAVHEAGGEICALGIDDDSEIGDVLFEIWEVYASKTGTEYRAVDDFIKKVAEKTGNDFPVIFERPDIILTADATAACFDGTQQVSFHDEWFVPYRADELGKTMELIWNEVYALKIGERLMLGFVLIPPDDMLRHRLEDYLDSYAIMRAAVASAQEKAQIILSAATAKKSMRERSERVSELRSTILGLELDKEINEEIFLAYAPVSKMLRLERVQPPDATFFISGSGYGGKQIFGEQIGYPTENKKSRWQSPAAMLYKLDFYPQTKFEDRPPRARLGFTETLPIDIFIEANNIDWDALRGRNEKLKSIMEKCTTIFVKGTAGQKYTTDFSVKLLRPDGTRRVVRKSDSDVREKINRDYLAKTGIEAGKMANIPGGEAFVTPESITGTFVGDVVVCIDQSYPLSAEKPLVIECRGDVYKIKEGPAEIIRKIKEKKQDAMDMLLDAARHESLPKEIIELKLKNFERIGEFAINTNPHARRCDYLIVNEKIANMMHIALGSGFEADRDTAYHLDIVFDAPAQQLDVWGVDEKGKEHWILKKGKPVVWEEIWDNFKREKIKKP